MTEPAAGLHRVGLLGGMSWASTAAYYRMLNEFVADRIGGHASAPVTIHSVDFGQIEALQRAGDWPAQGRILAEAAAALERGGVEAVALATNTLHRVSDQIVAAISVPFVDLIDIVAAATAGYDAVGLLATGYTMSSDLYPKRLAAFGTHVLVPDGADFDTVHRVIYDELVHDVVTEQSRAAYRDVIARLVDRGAQAIVLACTEIMLLVRAEDSPVPVVDTAELHCRALTDFIITGAV
jgi:aspartate racemase